MVIIVSFCDILTVVVMMSTVFWIITLFSLLKISDSVYYHLLSRWYLTQLILKL
jgi:hypothetical protein